MLNSRCRNILYEILKSPGGVKIQKLSKIFQVSERTIRYDLDKIDYYLKLNHFQPLIRKANFGVCYTDDLIERKKVINSLKSQGTASILLTPEERLLEILYTFCTSPGLIKVDDLAKMLNVSKSTVANDVKRLKTIISNNDVCIYSNTNGSKLTGNETSIRITIVNLFLTKMDRQSTIEALDMIMLREDKKEYGVYLRLFEHINLEMLNRCLGVVSDAMSKQLLDDEYLYIASNLCLQLKRIKNGNIVSDNEITLNAYDYILRNIADEISNIYREYEGIIIDDPEKKYICKVLEYIASKTTQMNERINWAELQIIACNIVDNVSKKLQRNFNNDVTLLSGLSDELLTIVMKSRLRIPYKNPLVTQIKDFYRDIFQCVKENIYPLNKFLRREVSEDEIACIVMHFIDFLERNNKRADERPNVLIVSSEGGITVKMLCNRLSSLFDINIIDAIGYRDIRKLVDCYNIHYIVSTLDIDERYVKSIKVSPLLTTDDIEKLKKYLPTKIVDTRLIERIMEVVDACCKICDKDKLRANLCEIFGVKVNDKYTVNKMPELTNVLNTQNIIIDYAASSWQDAVRKSGEVLLANDYIKKEYIDDMLKTVNDIRTHAIISPGILFSHSRSYELAKKVGISMIKLKTPIYAFDDNEKVDIVFALAAIDSRSHLVALSQLAHILNDNKCVELIRKGKSPQDITDTLKLYYNNYTLSLS